MLPTYTPSENERISPKKGTISKGKDRLPTIIFQRLWLLVYQNDCIPTKSHHKHQSFPYIGIFCTPKTLTIDVGVFMHMTGMAYDR